MNEDDKLVIDAMARMGELAIRGEADKALIAELVEALERSVLLLRAAAGAIGQDGHDMDFTHVDGIPTDNIGFETDCENSVERSVSVLIKAREALK